MPSSASQRRTEMDRAVLVETQWGSDASPPFVPLWRRGAIQACAVILLVMLVLFSAFCAGFAAAYASLGVL